MMRNGLKILYFIFVALLLASCAGKQTVRKEIKLVWPPPPDEPRLSYVHYYTGLNDFKIPEKSALDTFIGERPGGNAQGVHFKKPYGVTAHDGKIYVTETAHRKVFVIDTVKEKMTFLGDRGMGRLRTPAGVAVDGQGLIFVSDAKLNRVFGYDEQGNLKIALGKKDEFQRPAGIAINKLLNRLYVVDTKDHKVKVYKTDGEKLFEFGKRGVEEGEFNYPTNVAIDRRNGNVVIVDTQNFRVQVFDKDGEFIFKFGALGDGIGKFARPKGVGIDSEGHIYVVDTAFNNVQIFDEKGSVLMFLGGAGAGPGKFQIPTGLYIDEDDKIYVVGSFFGRVQVFQYLGEKFKKAYPEKYRALKTLE